MNGTSSVGRPGRPKRLCRGATRLAGDIHRHRPPCRYAPPFQACKQGVAVHPRKRGALVIIAQKAQTRTDQANEEAAAKHREELGQYQTELLQRNTDLTQQIHT